MSLQKSIRTILQGAAGLVALVDARIRPDELDEADSLPALIIELDSNDALDTLDDAAGDESDVSFSVVCCGVSRSAATDLETLVRSRLNGYRGTSGDYTFRPITWSNTSFDHDVSEDGSDADDWFLNIVNFDAFVDQI